METPGDRRKGAHGAEPKERARLDRAQGVSVRGSRGGASRESEALGVRPGGPTIPPADLGLTAGLSPRKGRGLVRLSPKDTASRTTWRTASRAGGRGPARGHSGPVAAAWGPAAEEASEMQWTKRCGEHRGRRTCWVGPCVAGSGDGWAAGEGKGTGLPVYTGSWNEGS